MRCNSAPWCGSGLDRLMLASLSRLGHLHNHLFLAKSLTTASPCHSVPGSCAEPQQPVRPHIASARWHLSEVPSARFVQSRERHLENGHLSQHVVHRNIAGRLMKHLHSHLLHQPLTQSMPDANAQHSKQRTCLRQAGVLSCASETALSATPQQRLGQYAPCMLMLVMQQQPCKPVRSSPDFDTCTEFC